MRLYYEYCPDISSRHPHMVVGHPLDPEIGAMIAWCETNVSPSLDRSEVGPVHTSLGWVGLPSLASFQFAKQADALAFRLRWSA